jgi:hypothetical protein
MLLRLMCVGFSPPTGIKRNAPSGIKIYPNPSHGLVTIEMGDDFSLESSIDVSDYYGRVFSHKTIENHRSYSLDLSSLPKGVYFLKVKSGNKFYYSKLVIN